VKRVRRGLREKRAEKMIESEEGREEEKGAK
jgi:hypothetical protein